MALGAVGAVATVKYPYLQPVLLLPFIIGLLLLIIPSRRPRKPGALGARVRQVHEADGPPDLDAVLEEDFGVAALRELPRIAQAHAQPIATYRVSRSGGDPREAGSLVYVELISLLDRYLARLLFESSGWRWKEDILPLRKELTRAVREELKMDRAANADGAEALLQQRFQEASGVDPFPVSEGSATHAALIQDATQRIVSTLGVKHDRDLAAIVEAESGKALEDLESQTWIYDLI